MEPILNAGHERLVQLVGRQELLIGAQRAYADVVHQEDALRVDDRHPVRPDGSTRHVHWGWRT